MKTELLWDNTDMERIPTTKFIMKTELEEAIWMANKILDVPNGDPDDDMRTISRQLLRTLEQNAALSASLKELIPLVEEYTRIRSVKLKYSPDHKEEWERIKSAIERAKKLAP